MAAESRTAVVAALAGNLALTVLKSVAAAITGSAAMLAESFRVPTWITGIVLTALTAIVILGGIQSIAAWCERLVPFMAVFYVLGCLAILFINAAQIPGTVGLILSTAFSGQAAVGGFLGAGMKEAIRFGVARGLFSNESGLGSAPIVAAACAIMAGWKRMVGQVTPVPTCSRDVARAMAPSTLHTKGLWPCRSVHGW